MDYIVKGYEVAVVLEYLNGGQWMSQEAELAEMLENVVINLGESAEGQNYRLDLYEITAPAGDPHYGASFNSFREFVESYQ